MERGLCDLKIDVYNFFTFFSICVYVPAIVPTLY